MFHLLIKTYIIIHTSLLNDKLIISYNIISNRIPFAYKKTVKTYAQTFCQTYATYFTFQHKSGDTHHKHNYATHQQNYACNATSTTSTVFAKFTSYVDTISRFNFS